MQTMTFATPYFKFTGLRQVVLVRAAIAATNLIANILLFRLCKVMDMMLFCLLSLPFLLPSVDFKGLN